MPEHMRMLFGAGGCGLLRCRVECFEPSDYEAAALRMLHNGHEVKIAVSAQAGYYDAWSDVVTQWASIAHELHREDALQSDWPVF